MTQISLVRARHGDGRGAANLAYPTTATSARPRERLYGSKGAHTCYSETPASVSVR